MLFSKSALLWIRTEASTDYKRAPRHTATAVNCRAVCPIYWSAWPVQPITSDCWAKLPSVEHARAKCGRLITRTATARVVASEWTTREACTFGSYRVRSAQRHHRTVSPEVCWESKQLGEESSRHYETRKKRFPEAQREREREQRATVTQVQRPLSIAIEKAMV